MNAIVKTEAAPKPETSIKALSLQWLPQNYGELAQYAACLAGSGLAPAGFHGKPEACLIAMQYGAALGLNPLQAVQNIAVINGRPALWGDAMLALVKSSPLHEWIKETLEGDTATCTVKRRGEPEQSRQFSWKDAQQAGLAGKKGPWQEYPKRMLQLRARALALRDLFPDVLMGLGMAEEVIDIPTDATPSAPEAAPAQPAYPQEKFEQFLPQWKELVQNGKQTAQSLITMIESKARLSDEQKAVIRALQTQPEAQEQAEETQS